jgi:hypothetical protein
VSDELSTGLADSSNEPSVESPSTPDAVLDAAFASPGESATPDPSVPAEPATPPADATVQPQTTPELKSEAVPGEPPREKWEHILANARTKARDEALAEHRDALEIVNRLRSDFSGTLSQMLEEAAADGRFSEAITAKAAAILNARRQQAKADQEPQPDAVMKFEDGTTEPHYTPAQWRKLVEWRERQMEHKFSEKFKPLQQLQERIQTAEQRQRVIDQANQVAKQRGEYWQKMPLYTEHKDAILKRQQEIFEEMRSAGPIDANEAPWMALQTAYAEVITSQALPKLQAQQTATMVATAQHKRAGSSSDPAASLPAQARRPRTLDEALDQAFEGATRA